MKRIASSTIIQEKECLNQLGEEVGVKGKGEMHHLGPPIPPSTTDSPPPSSAPSAASGAHTPYNPVLARQQAQEKKYPLWKYVTRKDGPGAKLGGGGNVSWRCNFCNHEFMSTYFRVKGHLLALVFKDRFHLLAKSKLISKAERNLNADLSYMHYENESCISYHNTKLINTNCETVSFSTNR